jgi:hypothetical protein
MAPQNLIESLSEVCIRASELYWGIPQGSWIVGPLVSKPPFGERMAMILIGQAGFRITLKIHYNNKNVRQMPGNKGMSSTLNAAEVIREALNQIGGRVRMAFEAGGTAAAIGLPVLTRGFDEVFSRSADDLTCFSGVWSVRAPNELPGEPSQDLFILSLLLEVSDQSSLEGVTLDPAAWQGVAQDMELL